MNSRRYHSITSSASGDQRRRHGEPERLRRPRIDDEIELAQLRDRQVGGLRTLEHAAGVDAGLPIGVVDIGTVADQAARIDELARRNTTRESHGVLPGWQAARAGR